MTDQQLAIKRKIHAILWGDDRVVKEDLFDAVDRIAIAWDAELAELRKKALQRDEMLSILTELKIVGADSSADYIIINGYNKISYGCTMGTSLLWHLIKDGKIVE